MSTVHQVGVNTWVWTSPLDDAWLRKLVPIIAARGFDVVELPVENPGDWDPREAKRLLVEHDLGASVVLVMPPGRELVDTDAATVSATQDYLRHCLDIAAELGSPTLCGPAYASVGRTWRMTERQRAACVREWRDHITPVLEHARDVGVTLGVEPLNRYETSLFNTVEQTLRPWTDCLPAVCARPLPPEQRSATSPRRSARPAAVAHVQVCANDRGTPGRDHSTGPNCCPRRRAGYTGQLYRVVHARNSRSPRRPRSGVRWPRVRRTRGRRMAFLKEVMAEVHYDRFDRSSTAPARRDHSSPSTHVRIP